MTSTNHETVRRYLSGHNPSVEFLHALCRGLSLNADWLITGEGPMMASDLPEHAVNAADTPTLLTAVGAVMQKLDDRIDQLEQLTRSLDARLRAREGSQGGEGLAELKPLSESTDGGGSPVLAGHAEVPAGSADQARA